jgi:hypothetical protein
LYSAPNTTVLAGFQRVLRGERADSQHFLILSTGVPWLLWQPFQQLLLSPPLLSLAPLALLNSPSNPQHKLLALHVLVPQPLHVQLEPTLLSLQPLIRALQ